MFYFGDDYVEEMIRKGKIPARREEPPAAEAREDAGAGDEAPDEIGEDPPGAEDEGPGF